MNDPHAHLRALSMSSLTDEILAAKRDLDAGRRDGAATWITAAAQTLDWLLDKLPAKPLAEIDPHLDVWLRARREDSRH